MLLPCAHEQPSEMTCVRVKNSETVRTAGTDFFKDFKSWLVFVREKKNWVLHVRGAYSKS